jgi:hypothetical protein
MGHTGYSRIIFNFPIDYIQSLICNKTFADISKLKHTLKLWNAGALDFRQIFEPCATLENRESQRAQSFDLILFRVPEDFDNGRGHDNLVGNYFSSISPTGCGNSPYGDTNQSCCGSSWTNCKTGYQWGRRIFGNYSHLDGISYDNLCAGIYDNKFLQDEYRKYLNHEKSIIINTQHIDLGSENIEMDVTDIVNKMATQCDGYPNHGFCIAFDPFIEETRYNPIQSFNLFSPRTSTWFEPYIQSEYNEGISDDRADFYIGKPNRLYFYSNIGGSPTNLMELPTCTVTGVLEDGSEFTQTYETRQATAGVYYIDIIFDSNDNNIVANRMFYDTWGNLKYYDTRNDNIVSIPDKVLEFTTKDYSEYFLSGDNDFLPKQYTPILYGIKYNEKIRRDEGFRKVYIECSIPYTVQQSALVDDLYYRIHIREGNKEIDAFDGGWKPVNRTFNTNYFILDTTSLLPHEYYIDIQTKSNIETRRYNKLVNFEIISNDKDGHYN